MAVVVKHNVPCKKINIMINITENSDGRPGDFIISQDNCLMEDITYEQEAEEEDLLSSRYFCILIPQ